MLSLVHSTLFTQGFFQNYILNVPDNFIKTGGWGIPYSNPRGCICLISIKDKIGLRTRGREHRPLFYFYDPVKESIYQVEEVAGSKIISISGSNKYPMLCFSVRRVTVIYDRINFISSGAAGGHVMMAGQ